MSQSEVDTMFESIRNKETFIGNLLSDIFRIEVGADVCMLNSGCIRADRIYPAKVYTYGNSILFLYTYIYNFR